MATAGAPMALAMGFEVPLDDGWSTLNAWLMDLDTNPRQRESREITFYQYILNVEATQKFENRLDCFEQSRYACLSIALACC